MLCSIYSVQFVQYITYFVEDIISLGGRLLDLQSGHLRGLLPLAL